tara:strand:- start:360 stop:1241 length:882 start_codon:yes stop_codon:yes gene_type:complete
MKITNKHNLPLVLIDWIENSNKQRQLQVDQGDFTVTQLLSNPKEQYLLSRNPDIEVDASQFISVLSGEAWHAGIAANSTNRRFNGALVEKRFSIKYHGWKITGQPDVIDGDYLMDYKESTVGRFAKGVPQEYENQLNFYHYILSSNGKHPKFMGIWVKYKDYMPSRAGTNHYPDAAMQYFPVQIWDYDEQDAFIKSRIEAHVGNLNSQLDKMDMPQCTDEERWYSNEVHAVMKKGGKRSLHNAATHEDAQAWIDGANTRVKKDQLTIERRPGVYRKCENYCFAKSVCDQYNNQ